MKKGKTKKIMIGYIANKALVDTTIRQMEWVLTKAFLRRQKIALFWIVQGFYNKLY